MSLERVKRFKYLGMILQIQILIMINPLKTKRRLLYLKTQFLPRSYKPISLCCKWHKSLFVLR
jgi:hypothetical protein